MLGLFAQAFIFGILMGCLYGLMALGLALIYGVMKVINLAHGQFFTLSGFIAFTLLTALKIDPLISLAILIPLFFAIGAVIQRVLINPVIPYARGRETLIITMGLGLIMENIVLMIWGPDFRAIITWYSAINVPLGVTSVGLVRIAAAAIAIAASLLTYVILVRTKIGMAMRACAQDREAAMLMGVDFNKITTLTFGVSAATAAITGPFMGMLFSLYPAVGGLYTLKSYCIVVLGGLENPVGAIVGGLIFGVVESIASIFLPAGYKNAIAFGVFVLTLLLKPSGLLGRAR